MHRLKITLLLSIIFSPITLTAQVGHPEVQTALNWQLPAYDCKFNVIRSGVGSGLDRKYKKELKKFNKCVAKYKIELLQQQKKMMAVAQHGLSQEQANIIMGHIMVIQQAVQTDGLRPAASPEDAAAPSAAPESLNPDT